MSELRGCPFQDVLDAYGMFVLLEQFLKQAYEAFRNYTINVFQESVTMSLRDQVEKTNLETLVQSWVLKIVFLADAYDLFKNGDVSSNRKLNQLLHSLAIHLQGQGSNPSVNYIHPSIKGGYSARGSTIRNEKAKLALCCENFLVNLSLESLNSIRDLLSKSELKILKNGGKKVRNNKYK